MSERRFLLGLPFGGLYGASFYRAAEIQTENGYRNESIDGNSLPWRWYVCEKTGECVRAFPITEPLRVLSSPVGLGKAAYDIPARMWPVHDLGRIWAMEAQEFTEEHMPAGAVLASAK